MVTMIIAMPVALAKMPAGLMPIRLAVVGSSEVARKARPSEVR
jgi:hypothetical protein